MVMLIKETDNLFPPLAATHHMWSSPMIYYWSFLMENITSFNSCADDNLIDFPLKCDLSQ